MSYEGQCDLCGEIDDECHAVEVQKRTLTFCERCANEYEECEKIKGRYRVKRCRTCHHVKEVTFVPYKKCGPKPGTVRKPKPKNRSLREWAENRPVA